MHKSSYQPYLVLFLALIVVLSIPNRVQDVLRNQFIKPIIPFSYLVPKKAIAQLSYKKEKKKSQEASIPSYPGATIARIIHRSPSTWNQSVWINLGTSSNKEKKVITKLSPVLYENALVGIVDYVGKKQSRVKLITNMNLTISVRAERGANNNATIIKSISHLLSYQFIQENSYLSGELTSLKNNLQSESDDWYLAKGEINGMSSPLWRSNNKLLIGKGFNCEIPDSLSNSRELFTGKANAPYIPQMPIIAPDDLLVTTGLEGIFPPEIPVAKVTEVEPLEEGSFYYSIKAFPIISNLDDLSTVDVILPTEFQNLHLDD